MAKSSIPLTQERLKQVLDYDPETGVFLWKTRKSVHVFAGNKAGCIDVYGYVQIQIDGKKYRAQRLAWLYVSGCWPSREIDHEDLCKSNNVWTNLREATHSQNAHNRPKYSNNSSGFKGVTYSKSSRKWHVNISANGTKKYLGSFDSAELGHQAYCAAASEMHGDFVRIA